MWTQLFLCSVALAGVIWAAPPPEEDYQHRWWFQCGVSSYPDAGTPWSAEGRIHQGRPARPHEFPWTASIKWTPADDKWDHTCQATLIHPKWVVTAAHCMAGAPIKRYKVALGEHNPSIPNEHRQVIDVKMHYYHPRYGMDNRFEADVAVIELATDAVISDYVMPACAPSPSYDYVGYDGVVAGWGEQNSWEWDLPDELLWVSEKVISNEECSERNNGVTENMICVTTYEDIKGACGGDNGAGLVVDNGVAQQRWELIGVFAWSPGCMTDFPQVHTRIGNYRDWIDSFVFGTN